MREQALAIIDRILPDDSARMLKNHLCETYVMKTYKGWCEKNGYVLASSRSPKTISDVRYVLSHFPGDEILFLITPTEYVALAERWGM